MASAEELVKKVEAGAEIEDSKPLEAVATYRDVIFGGGRVRRRQRQGEGVRDR